MSTRGLLRRQARDDARLDQYYESGHWAPTPTMHGVCRRCGKRTYLTRPAKVCNRRCMRELVLFDYALKWFGIT